jgi:phosphoribosylformylglycinamidine synthase
VAASPDKADAIHKAAAVAKVPLRLLGKVGGNAIKLEGEPPLSLAALRAAHEAWLPRFMAHGQDRGD